MSASLNESVKAVMADVLDVDVASIDERSSMETLERWDSGNHVRLVLALEEVFDVSFDVSEIEAMVRFDALLATLARKL